MKSTININEIIFEEKDTQIFNIPDTKTKLSTLQKYFLPRLEKLLRYTLDIVAEVYNVNPYERMTFVYCPSHRQKAKENLDFGMVHIGVTAKRGNKPLKIMKRNGKPFFFHPTYLTFKVLPNGTIYTEFLPFRQGVDANYVAEISALVKQHSNILIPLLSLGHISHISYDIIFQLIPIYDAIIPEAAGMDGFRLVSPKYYFPVSWDRGLFELIIAFTLLYALAESFICIGEGRQPELEKMLKQFQEWYINLDTLDRYKAGIEAENKEVLEPEEIPELDSYSFVRPGKWWAVLARDKWKCLSCGRTSREDGATLEVDHIVPRSKGGTDEMDNLQTLCKKCNIGKSNKDSTRL